MQQTPFYQYPMQTARLMRALPPGQTTGSHPTYALGHSIAQLLYLLLHTQPGQLRCAPDFGCAVWELEFSSYVNVAQWEDALTRSLLRAVQQHEPRLRDARVRLSLSATAPADDRGTDALTRTLQQATRQHDPRLRDGPGSGGRRDTTLDGVRRDDSPARWYAEVAITGVVELTQEPFSFSTQLRVGRLAT